MTVKQQTNLQNTLTVAHSDYEKSLNSFAFFKIHDHSLGEDMVQDTFLKTWKYLVRGGKIEVMKAFLYHILNNLIIDEYRKNKPTSLDVMQENGFDPKDESAYTSTNLIDGKNALSLISKLPDKYQKVMKMKYAQNLTLQEMSLITGKSKNSLAVQIHRGLEKLKLIFNSPKIAV